MVEIHVPRLAERQGDLALLTRHFVSKFASQYGKHIRGITRRAEIQMAMHKWPGNVRELENVIGHAAMMNLGDMIDVQDLPPYLTRKKDETADSPPAGNHSALGTLEETERMLVVRALEEAMGNQSKAARHLRIGRDALRYKMKKYGLEGVASES
jgi:DNA-binding NtrC family response regulator